MPQNPSQILLSAQPLTAVAFQPFGKLLEHGGTTRRRMIEKDFSNTGHDFRQAIWISRLAEPCTLPVAIDRLERHPHSPQVFVPLLGKPFLVVCCPDLADGAPDLSGARAFIAGPHQGVIYRRNVWHAGLQVLDAPAEFVVVQTLTGDRDDILVDLETPLCVFDDAASATAMLEDRP